MTDRTQDAPERMVAFLLKAVSLGEDGAGILPARDSVKVRPPDWHEICRLARLVPDMLEAARADERRKVVEEACARLTPQARGWPDATVNAALTAATREIRALAERTEEPG